MPFITEELWQRLPKIQGEVDSICISNFPQYHEERNNNEINSEFEEVYSIIKTARQLENTYSITKHKKPKLTIDAKNNSILTILNNYKNIIATLAYAGECEIRSHIEPIKGCAVGIPNENSIIYLHIKGMVDKTTEIKNLETKIKKLQEEIKSLSIRMNRIDYYLVPDEIKEQNKEKSISMNQELSNTQKALTVLSSLDD